MPRLKMDKISENNGADGLIDSFIGLIEPGNLFSNTREGILSLLNDNYLFSKWGIETVRDTNSELWTVVLLVVAIIFMIFAAGVIQILKWFGFWNWMAIVFGGIWRKVTHPFEKIVNRGTKRKVRVIPRSI